MEEQAEVETSVEMVKDSTEDLDALVNETLVVPVVEGTGVSIKEAPVFDDEAAVVSVDEAPIVSVDDESPIVSVDDEAPVVSDDDEAPVVSDDDEAPVVSDDDEAPVASDDEAPVVSIDEMPVDSVNETPVDSVNEMPVDSVNETLVDSVNEIPLSPVDETPVSIVEASVLSTDETSVVSPEETSVVSTDETSFVSADETSVVSTDETSIASTEETSVVSTNEISVNNIDDAPIVSIDETHIIPDTETTVVSVKETSVVSITGTNIISNEKLDTPVGETPIAPADKTPVTPADKTTVTPSDKTPVTSTNEIPVTPADKTPVTPIDNTPVTPSDKIPVTPDKIPVTPTDKTPVIPTDKTSFMLDDEATKFIPVEIKQEQMSDTESMACSSPIIQTEPKEQSRNSRGRRKIRMSKGERNRRRSSASFSSDFSTEGRLPIKREGMVFKIGTKLRARDFSMKWYDAKIIDLDDEKNKIKIHFDRWNSRYDQWIAMDSKDLKAFSPDRSKKGPLYKVGDEVLAKWRDQNMYPAKIEKSFDNGNYLVIFYDGFVNKLPVTSMEALPPKCIGKLKFPTLEEAKKMKRNSAAGLIPDANMSELSEIRTPVVSNKEAEIWEILKITSPKLIQSQEILDNKKVATKEFIIEEDHNHFKCTVPGCIRSYRKEMLLKSHFKHTHNLDYVSFTKANAAKRKTKDIMFAEPAAKKQKLLDKPPDHSKPSVKDAKRPTESSASSTVRKKTDISEDRPQTVLKPLPKSARPKGRPRITDRALHRDSPSTVVAATAILPMRSSTRKISLPAKFASDEICLMQPLGRDRTISTGEQSLSVEPEKKAAKKERTHRNRDNSESQRTKSESTTKEAKPKTEKPKEKVVLLPIPEKKVEEDEKPVKDIDAPKELDDDSIAKGPAVAKKISLEANPDPERIERMITIASSSKKRFTPGVSRPSVGILHKRRKVDSSVSPCTNKDQRDQSSDLKVKSPAPVEESNDKPVNSQPLLTSALMAPPLIQKPAEATDSVLEENKQEETKVTEASKEPVKPADSLNAIAMSLRDILNSGFLKSSVEPVSTTNTIMEDKSSEVSPSAAGHVMCTRRREAILEKEKATTQSIGKHVMCTRKKSEKLAAVEQKFKQKATSPGKTNVPMLTSSSLKRRRLSPPPSNEISKKSCLRNEPISPAKEVSIKDFRDSGYTFPKDIKIEPPDVHDSGTGSIPHDEETVDKEPIAEEVVHCVCGCWEEEGLMMQCEICLTWQHGSCFNIEEEKDVPEKYVCYACINPKGLRESQRYKYDQSWFKKGDMPNFPFVSPQTASLSNPQGIHETHSLVTSLHNVFSTLRSVNHKINIVSSAETHPDLPLFSKPCAEESDEADIEDREHEGKRDDAEEPSAASLSDNDNNKHELTSQNLVTFDHSYYSPEVDILDLDAMPLIIDDDFKSVTSADGDDPTGKTSVNVKELVNDILKVDRETLQRDLIDATTSSSTESADEQIDEDGYSSVVDRNKETILSNDEESNMEMKYIKTDQQIGSSGLFASAGTMKKITFEAADLKPVKAEVSKSPKFKFTKEAEKGANRNNYASEADFCKPASPSISKFFGGLNQESKLVLPLTSYEKEKEKEDLLNDFNYTAKCKRNLMDHIKTTLSELEPELDRVEELVNALEKEEFSRPSQLESANKMPKRGVRVPNYRKLKRLRKDLELVYRTSNFPTP